MHIFINDAVLQHAIALAEVGYHSALSLMVYDDKNSPTEEKMIIIQKEDYFGAKCCSIENVHFLMHPEEVQGNEGLKIIFLAKISFKESSLFQ
jgi:hypothetical protein